jgi:hypothetical protein
MKARRERVKPTTKNHILLNSGHLGNLEKINAKINKKDFYFFNNFSNNFF